MKIILMLVACLFSTAALAQNFAKYDTRLPIEVTADSLEVLQQDRRAVFRGNVVAVQGQMRLRADVMTVTYRQGGERTQGENTISRLDVDGNVFMTTPEETAKGDKGVYNVDKKEVVLQGNIALTKQKNVLKGDRLEYNLATGKSLVTGNAGAATKDGAVPGTRVRGLFVPGAEGAK